MGYVNKTYLSTQFKNFADKIAKVFSKIGHTHLKSDITDFPTSMPANGGNAATVGGHTVGVNVPSNAKFTDTTYGVATSSALGLVKSGTDITVDSSGNVSVNDDSHNHVISNVDGLQSALDGKSPTGHTHTSINGVIPEWSGSISFADTEWLAAWNSDGTKIKALNKNNFATVSHTHNYAGSSSAGGSANSALGLSPLTISNIDELNSFLSDNAIMKYAKASNCNIGFVSNDGLVISLPWSSNYGAQIAIDDQSNWMGIRTKNNGTWNSWSKIALVSDIPTNNNQLTNGAGYITSSGSCNYATSAGNANTVDGFHASQSAGSKSTCVVTDSNGYTNLNYINSNTGNNENPSISQIIVTNGSDNYYRKASLAHLKSSLGSMPASDVYAWAKASIKPSYTASEVGLGNVDNTADSAKSVKYATSAGSASSALKATGVVDYGSPVNTIQIGYGGAGISGDAIKYIAGYTTGNGSDVDAKIKDVSKDALKSWLGLGSLAYSSATIPTVPSSLPANGGNSATVNGHTVNSDVPANAKFTDTNTWRPLGTTADTACAGNDSRLSNARPASDVYAWAKASSKPSYTASEVGAISTSENTTLNATIILGKNDEYGIYPNTNNFCQLGRSNLKFWRMYATNGYFDKINDGTPITSSNIGSQSVNYASTAGSAPASDVYSWAKASSKPSYSWSEITGKPFTTVDSALSGTSTNPVQNNIVKLAVDTAVPNFVQGGGYSGDIDTYKDGALVANRSYFVQMSNLTSSNSLPISSGYGILYSIGTGNAIIQMIYHYNTSTQTMDAIYSRVYINGGWHYWSKIAATKVS